jgi:hypothetical protein
MEDEVDAHEKGRNKLNGDYKVVELPTVDMSAATRMIKARILEETGDLTRALERARHPEAGTPQTNYQYEGD